MVEWHDASKQTDLFKALYPTLCNLGFKEVNCISISVRLIWLTSLPDFSALNTIISRGGRGGGTTGGGGLNFLSWKAKQSRTLLVCGRWFSRELSRSTNKEW